MKNILIGKFTTMLNYSIQIINEIEDEIVYDDPDFYELQMDIERLKKQVKVLTRKYDR